MSVRDPCLAHGCPPGVTCRTPFCSRLNGGVRLPRTLPGEVWIVKNTGPTSVSVFPTGAAGLRVDVPLGGSVEVTQSANPGTLPAQPPAG